MLQTLCLFFGSALLIYFACHYFVNGIEWLGQKWKLGATATGSLLAAFGTALPESAVTFSAVVFGKTSAAKNIGIGAALGGPLVLATLAYGIVGLALWRASSLISASPANLRVLANSKRLSRDQLSFLSIFVFKVALGLVAFHYKPALGILFLLAYVVYAWREIRTSETAIEEEALEPLRFSPNSAQPRLLMILLQLGIALAVIAFASQLFVSQIENLGALWGMSGQMIALLLSPVATEMPEIMNALIWVKQGKERLALANISGAMMIQATIPSALGIFFTPWLLSPPLILAAVVTGVATLTLFFLFRKRELNPKSLACVSLFYGLFVALLIVFL